MVLVGVGDCEYWRWLPMRLLVGVALGLGDCVGGCVSSWRRWCCTNTSVVVIVVVVVMDLVLGGLSLCCLRLAAVSIGCGFWSM